MKTGEPIRIRARRFCISNIVGFAGKYSAFNFRLTFIFLAGSK